MEDKKIEAISPVSIDVSSRAMLRMSTTRLAENLSASVDMAEDTEVGEGDGGDDETVENHLFPRSRTYLRGILPPYAPKSIGKAIKQSSRRAT